MKEIARALVALGVVVSMTILALHDHLMGWVGVGLVIIAVAAVEL